MLINTNLDENTLDIDIFNAIVGFEEEQTIDKKTKRSQRMFAARRAIEKHRESKLLAQCLNETYDSDFND
jgi:hypothetical protein